MNLKEMGSFHIGGREITVEGQPIVDAPTTASGIPSKFDPNGTYQVEQMYVQYFIPEPTRGELPLLLWHGAGLSGVTYETTPDGREGWLQYFIKKGWAVFNSDAVERGRSGWAPYHSAYHEKPVLRPKKEPFERYHIGEGAGSYSKDLSQMKVLPGNQFPIEGYENFTKQMIPRWMTTDDAAVAAYIELIDKVGPCAILAHSQGGQFAFRAAMARPELVKAIIAVEPAIGGDLQLALKLHKTAILFIYGDYIAQDDRWSKIRDHARKDYDELKQAGGSVHWIDLPQLGIRGNSHMMMMDRNNLEVADVIQAWLQDNNLYR